MVFLKYVGTEGDGANNAGQRNLFGIGYGTALNYRRRVTKPYEVYNILRGLVQKRDRQSATRLEANIFSLTVSV
jgi:hypothetical protein